MGIVVDVRTNSMGLRDAEIDLSDPARRRVLLIGDSFTFGEGLDVEHTFAYKLEALLNGTTRGYEAINAGVGGWGTEQATRYARDHFAEFRPDAIVLTFCGNDPDDDETFAEGKLDNERGRFYFPGKILIREHSQLYGFLYRARERWLRARSIKQKLRTHPNLVIDLQSSTLISEEQWRATLGRIRAFCDDFLSFNPRGQVLVQATYPMNEDIRSHLRTLSQGGNCVFVDLYEEARKLGAGKIRLPYDGHWTESMHDISARALYQELIQRMK